MQFLDSQPPEAHPDCCDGHRLTGSLAAAFGRGPGPDHVGSSQEAVLESPPSCLPFLAKPRCDCTSQYFRPVLPGAGLAGAAAAAVVATASELRWSCGGCGGDCDGD